MKDFAPEYNRDEEGRVLFPRDTDLRASLFPAHDPTTHIAKANMWMVKALIEYVSEPGESILDPFAGTGTILIGATLGRNIYMVELEKPFLHDIETNIKTMKMGYPDIEQRTLLLSGDSAKILPIPNWCNHTIFSPPYPMGLKKKGSMDRTSQDLGYSAGIDYSADPDNFTNLNLFLYHRRIEEFYKKCLVTLTPGGTMTIIIKDNVEKGERVRKADRTERDCVRMGFELVSRYKWYTPGGGYSAVNKAHGLETVDEEDLITFRRPA